jgi:ABC-2 type transport system permease protein
MCFLSGLWLPISFLPQGIRAVAAYLPGFHLGQLGLLSLGVRVPGEFVQHAAVLAGYSAVFAGLAWFGYRREQEKMYG